MPVRTVWVKWSGKNSLVEKTVLSLMVCVVIRVHLTSYHLGNIHHTKSCHDTIRQFPSAMKMLPITPFLCDMSCAILDCIIFIIACQHTDV